MVDMLKKAASGRPGVDQLQTEHGGKTGTTQNQTDAWYMGITPNLVVGTWVGGEDRWIRFRSLTLGQGSVMARPIFAQFIKRLEDDPELDRSEERRVGNECRKRGSRALAKNE